MTTPTTETPTVPAKAVGPAVLAWCATASDNAWDNARAALAAAAPFIVAASQTALLAEVERLRAQRDAVLALHRPDGEVGGPGAMCVECTGGFGTPSEDPTPWPCPTARALGVEASS